MTKCECTFSDLEPPNHCDEIKHVPPTWSCSRDAVDGETRCKYHLTNKEREKLGIPEHDIQHEIQSAIQSTNSSLDFVGCNLPALDLSGLVIDSSTQEALDFRCAKTNGKLNLSDTKFRISLKAHLFESGRGGIDIRDAEFCDRASFYGSRIKGSLKGKGSHFRGEADFSNVKLTNSIKLHDSTKFGDLVKFKKLQIISDGTFQIRGAIFQGRCLARQIDVPEVDCRGAKFRREVKFSSISVGGDFKAERARFDQDVDFGDSDPQKYNHDGPSEITGTTDFSKVIAERHVNFNRVQFRDELKLTNSDFYGKVQLVLTSLENHVTLSGSTFNRSLIIKPLYCKHEDQNLLEVELADTTINEGVLAQPGNDRAKNIHYEFQDSTIGDVRFYDTILIGDQNPTLLECYNYNFSLEYATFWKTKFTDFDFAPYHTTLHGNWNIHELDINKQSEPETVADWVNQKIGSFSQIPSSLFNIRQAGWLAGYDSSEYSGLEQTYRYAKIGAVESGNNRASSEFFIKELDARTAQYSSLQSEANNRIKLMQYWSQYWAYRSWKTIRYSESALRVFGMAFVTICIFAIVFMITGNLLGFTSPHNAGSIGYLIFSFESFVTLVHEPGTTIDSTFIRGLAAVQGFIGAFFIALFVFSLTRTVHR